MRNVKNYLKNLDIVYIDDDLMNTQKVGELLKNFFRNVFIYNDPKEFLDSINTKNYDLILSDICMPSYSGIELVKTIRASNKKVPIILLTAFSNEEYLFESANLNIQSYIIKPLNFEKLTSAFENVLDYFEVTNNLAYHIDEFCFDRNTLKLTKENKEISLNKKEKSLLYLLISNTGKIVSYEEIESKIWLIDDEVMTQNALRTIVKTLRKKLDDTTLIKNISGCGYIFDNK